MIRPMAGFSQLFTCWQRAYEVANSSEHMVHASKLPRLQLSLRPDCPDPQQAYFVQLTTVGWHRWVGRYIHEARSDGLQQKIWYCSLWPGTLFSWIIQSHDDCKALSSVVRCSWTLLDLQAATHAVVEAAAMLHSHDLVHADLRAANIFWRLGKPFLTDLEQVHKAGFEVRFCTTYVAICFGSGKRRNISTLRDRPHMRMGLPHLFLLSGVRFLKHIKCALHPPLPIACTSL